MSKKILVFGSVVFFLLTFLAGLLSPRIFNLEAGTGPLDGYSVSPNSDLDDIFWANEIVKDERELLLWFRHGEREKWTGTVTVFDYFDVNGTDFKYPNSWRPAVCLTSKGIAESQLVGITFRELGVTASSVITSPSCRAKETAIEAFGGYDESWLEILHATAVTTQQQQDFAARLRNKILKEFNISEGRKGHILVTGHGNTLPFYEETLFESSEVKDWNVSELGFIVIEKTPEGLIARHSFVEFYQFANALLKYKE
jgi:phosphohistidine phosphatase SixA